MVLEELGSLGTSDLFVWLRVSFIFENVVRRLAQTGRRQGDRELFGGIGQI